MDRTSHAGSRLQNNCHHSTTRTDSLSTHHIHLHRTFLAWSEHAFSVGAEIAGVDNAGVGNDGGKAQEVDNDGVDFTEFELSSRFSVFVLTVGVIRRTLCDV